MEKERLTRMTEQQHRELDEAEGVADGVAQPDRAAAKAPRSGRGALALQRRGR